MRGVPLFPMDIPSPWAPGLRRRQLSPHMCQSGKTIVAFVCEREGMGFGTGEVEVGRAGSSQGVTLPWPSQASLDPGRNPSIGCVRVRARMSVCLCIYAQSVIGGDFPQGRKSDEFLPCSVLQVEYAYSDNSLDPGESLPYRLRLQRWNDNLTSALRFWVALPATPDHSSLSLSLKQ